MSRHSWFSKLAAIILVINLTLFTNPVIYLAWAQEATDSTAATTTGDASSTAQADTGANATAVTSEPASTPAYAPPPGLEAREHEGHRDQRASTLDATVSVDNQASTTTDASAGANTGYNTVDTNGDGVVDTGDAISTAEANTQANTNLVTLDHEGHEASPDRILSNSIYEGRHSNDATVNNSSNADSNTGNNSINATGTGTIVTGDAYSFANSNTITNTNVVNGGLDFLVYNITSETQGDINLNDIWQQLGLSTARHSGVSNPFLNHKSKFKQNILNQANVTNQAIANADTGKNYIVGANGEIITGDAFAAANAVSLTNTNLINSSALFAIINIFDMFTGNIIVPWADSFFGLGNTQQSAYFSKPGHRAPRGDLSGPGNATLNFNNTASMDNLSQATANTGQNAVLGDAHSSGDQHITTGDSYALSNGQAITNTNLIGTGQFDLNVNNVGDWNGQVVNYGGQNLELGAGNSYLGYSLANPSYNNLGGSKVLAKLARHKFEAAINNQATVQNLAQATANTGDNTVELDTLDKKTGELVAGGDAVIQTGNAQAVSNAISIANTNAVHSGLFWGALNIFGNWNGNLIFAKPDVSVGVSDGQEAVSEDGFVNYAVAVRNNGGAPAQAVQAATVLPEGLEYVGSSMPAQQNGNEINWDLGAMEAGDQELFTLTARLREGREPGDPNRAARGGNIRTTVEVNTDADSNSDNNSSSDDSEIPGGQLDIPEATNSASLATPSATLKKSLKKTELPELVVDGKTTTGEYVSPGETVPYQMVIDNHGKEEATNTVAYITVLGRSGVSNVMRVPLGNIAPKEEVVVDMGIAIKDNFTPGKYRVISKVVGSDSTGGKVSSNIDEAPFYVRILRALMEKTISEAQALEPTIAQELTPQAEDKGEVLGMTSFRYVRQTDLYPYLLALLTTVLWLIERERRTQQFSYQLSKLSNLFRKKFL